MRYPQRKIKLRSSCPSSRIQWHIAIRYSRRNHCPWFNCHKIVVYSCYTNLISRDYTHILKNYSAYGAYDDIYVHQFLQRVFISWSLLPNQRLDVNITSIAADTCKYRAGKVSPSETSRLSAARVRLPVRSRFDDLVRLICQRFAPTRCPSLYPGWTDGVGRRGISRKLEIYPRHSTRLGLVQIWQRIGGGEGVASFAMSMCQTHFFLVDTGCRKSGVWRWRGIEASYHEEICIRAGETFRSHTSWCFIFHEREYTDKCVKCKKFYVR